ncbi:hypothetical protein [Devosia sp.]|uniref:hypothetical protein n=1 Tax=Devosia sp. TaxID=1871048 RepID=UPI002632151D|nr:hypothetical protein [Devosia sp.]
MAAQEDDECYNAKRAAERDQEEVGESLNLKKQARPAGVEQQANAADDARGEVDDEQQDKPAAGGAVAGIGARIGEEQADKGDGDGGAGQADEDVGDGEDSGGDGARSGRGCLERECQLVGELGLNWSEVRRSSNSGIECVATSPVTSHSSVALMERFALRAASTPSRATMGLLDL